MTLHYVVFCLQLFKRVMDLFLLVLSTIQYIKGSGYSQFFKWKSKGYMVMEWADRFREVRMYVEIKTNAETYVWCCIEQS